MPYFKVVHAVRFAVRYNIASMIMINHLITGAAIALVVKEPVLMLPLAFVSHFVLDSLPHYGERGSDHEFKHDKLTWALIAIDMLASATFAFWLLEGRHYQMLLGAATAYLPDTAWTFRMVKYKLTGKVGPRSAFSRFHGNLQNEFSRGYAVELGYLITALVLLNKAL